MWLLSTSTALLVSLIVVGSVFYLESLGLVDPGTRRLVLYLPFILIPQATFELYTQVRRSDRRIRVYGLITLGYSTGWILIGGIGYLLGIGGERLYLVAMASSMATIVLIILWRGRDLFRAGYAKFLWVQPVLRFGLPLVPTFALSFVLDASDRLLLEYYLDSRAVGLYNAAYTVAWLPISLLTLVVSQSLAPIIVSLWENQGREATERYLGVIVSLFIVLAIPAVFVVGYLGAEILALAASTEYSSAHPAMKWVSLSAVLVGLQWIYQRGLILAEKSGSILVAFVLAAVSNVAFNVVLIPKLGLVGAALSTLGSSFLFLIAVGWNSRLYALPLLRRPQIMVFVSATALMLVVGDLWPSKGWLGCLVAIMAYAVILVAAPKSPITEVVKEFIPTSREI